MGKNTIRLTMAQALVKYLCNQYILIDDKKEQLYAGVFGIFGHGNVTCLAEALEQVKDTLPTWRGQNEQSMALAGIAYSKSKLRQQIMIATSSIGPGATNMITASALAHANRLPLLILSGDVFANRRPDPVLQQLEHFNNPTITANDAFKAVTRYWDRISHPEQIIHSLPQATAIMLDPSDCGPAFIGLCQDTQEIAYDYPIEFFEPKIHSIPRPRADKKYVEEAINHIKSSKKPLIIAGGGVRYSRANEVLRNFATKLNIPVSETIAGKGTLTHDDPINIGPIGVVGSTSANYAAKNADLVIAVGTRLQDFTTGSWTNFKRSTKFLNINTSRWDANKHLSTPVVGDAKVCIEEILKEINNFKFERNWLNTTKSEFLKWNKLVDDLQTPTNSPIPTYAQVVGLINKSAKSDTTMVTAAGGLPGEVSKGWKVKDLNTFDCEFGYSCMGYEIAGGWGVAMATKNKSVPVILVGDGSYLMMNSDIYSSVLSGHKMIIIVCDNGGFAVINRLQNFKGGKSFNNLIQHCKVKKPFAVDFSKHAESMGALVRHCENLFDLRDAMEWAYSNERTTVLSIITDAYTWTPGDADWDVGVPETSDRNEVIEARKEHEKIRSKQRVGI